MAYSNFYNTNAEYKAHIMNRASFLVATILKYNGLVNSNLSVISSLTSEERTKILGLNSDVENYTKLVGTTDYTNDMDEELASQKLAARPGWIHRPGLTDEIKQQVYNDIVANNN